MNNCHFIGRLTKEPEFRFTPQGTAVCTFTLAVQRAFKNESGQYEADFINCVVWKQQAELIAHSVKKGHRIAVSGRMQSRTFESDGKKVFVTELVVGDFTYLEKKPAEGTGAGVMTYSGGQTIGQDSPGPGVTQDVNHLYPDSYIPNK